MLLPNRTFWRGSPRVSPPEVLPDGAFWGEICPCQEELFGCFPFCLGSMLFFHSWTERRCSVQSFQPSAS